MPSTLHLLWEEGRRAWPDVVLSPEAFARHVQAVSPDALPDAWAADLYLACACARGDPGALDAFEKQLMPGAAEAVHRVDPSSDFVKEVLQEVRERLFVRAEGREPRISEYAGRGPLAGWLRSAAVRTALNLREHAHRQRDRNVPDAFASELPMPNANVELELFKKQYGPSFTHAMRTALAALNDRDRAVFRMHFLEGVSVTRVAQIFQVDRSTVTRWMARAREELLTRVLDELNASLPLPSTEVESLARLLRHQVDISLGALLKDPR